MARKVALTYLHGLFFEDSFPHNDLSHREEDIAHIHAHFFEKHEFDFAYVKAVVSAFPAHIDDAIALIESKTRSFGFDSMDVIDKCILVLGYLESKSLSTPIPVIVSEMVEMAKRYGDVSSPKLINAMGREML